MGKNSHKRKRSDSGNDAQSAKQTITTVTREGKQPRAIREQASSKRRRRKKNLFLENIARTHKAIRNEQNQKQQIRTSGKALGTISSLSSVLDEVTAPAKTPKPRGRKKPKSTRPGRKRMRNATRQKILAREVSLFSKVLKHPAFKDDPCQTIATHLNNTLVATDE